MVTAGGRRGASKLGCVVSLALFIGALYYGVAVGRIYWRYYEFVDDMRTAARFAQTQSDDVILRNLRERAVELGLPGEARRIGIRRSGPPSQIVIRTQYRELLELPFRSLWITFRPTVESRY